MITFLRALLVGLALLFTYFFGETLEQLLLQVIRIFIAVEPSNALKFNLVHAAILLTPLAIFGVLISIATVDNPALRKRAQMIVAGMLLGLLAYRAYQIWWILKLGAFGEYDTSRTESFTSGQIFFLERMAPWILLGIGSSIIPAIALHGSDSRFYAALTSLCIFIWLMTASKLPPGQPFAQSLTALGVTVLTGYGLGKIVTKIKES